MLVLVELANHAGETLAKEELIRAVWPNTFVGDDALVRCISELRRVFEDEPRSPHVIQTISKIGYRLIAPVTFPEPGIPLSRSGTEPTSPQLVPTMQPATETRKPRSLLWLVPVIILFLLATTISTLVLLYRFLERKADLSNVRTVPFTTYPGSERQPAFSPDGNKIAFVWNGEDGGDAWNVYVKMTGSETPLRLTNVPAEDHSPAWSPDGKWIAFIRSSRQEGSALFLVPTIGGPERKIHDLRGAIDWDDPGLSWTPDGKHIVFPDGKSQVSPSFILSLDVDSLQETQLTRPPSTWDGDFNPRVSPDGKTVAFIRGADGAARNIYLVPASGGQARQLTDLNRQVGSISWSADGDSIIFSSDMSGTFSLWRINTSGGGLERLPVGTESASGPAVSARNNRLAYSQGLSTWSLMRLDLRSSQSAGNRLVSSTEQDSAPQFSHDGKRIAYQSLRSGSQEIWTIETDGTGPVRMTSFNGPVTGSPSWSPDDRRLAFDSRLNGRSHIFVMNAEGGTPKMITEGDFNDIVPTWSADGRWIYFGSKRNASWQLWKVPADGGAPQQVTTSGGFVGRESLNGKWLYFTKYGVPGLWRILTSGGNEEKVLNDPPANYWSSWTISEDGVYFLADSNGHPTLGFYGFKDSAVRNVRSFQRWPARFSGISVSPNDRWLLYTDEVSAGNNIMLVEGFR